MHTVDLEYTSVNSRGDILVVVGMYPQSTFTRRYFYSSVVVIRKLTFDKAFNTLPSSILWAFDGFLQFCNVLHLHCIFYGL